MAVTQSKRQKDRQEEQGRGRKKKSIRGGRIPKKKAVPCPELPLGVSCELASRECHA